MYARPGAGAAEKMRKRSILAIGCWLLAAGSSELAAQTTLNDTLREVTVTETRHSHALKSTAPMHVLDRHDMQVQGVVDMADALHRLPGITLRDYGGAGGMKTVSVRGFGAKHTGVSYDGVLLSECQSGEIDLSRYSLDNVDHLSLVVGDNSDIFIPARNATTPATLQIQTIATVAGGSPSGFKPHLTAQLKAGSFGYTSPFLRYEQHLSPTLAVSAVGEYIYAENDYPYTIKNGIETIRDHRRNTRMNSGHAEVNLVYRGTRNEERLRVGEQSSGMGGTRDEELSAKLYYYDNDRQLPGQVFYYSNTSRETLRDRNFFGQVGYQRRWHSGWALKLNGKFNWAAALYDDGVVAGWVQDADYYQREAYGSMCLYYRTQNHWAFDYSADYAFNNLNSTLPTDTRPYRNTVLQSATAQYHTARLMVMARLLHSLYLNGAKDAEGAHDMRRLSPSLSLSYAVTPHLRLRASYKDIFRAPTFNENYFFHYGSKELKAEDTRQLNVGATYAANVSQHTELSATADFYYNKVTDLIQGVPHNMFVFTCVNIGKAEIIGLDVTTRAARQLGRHTLTAAVNYSLQRARDHTNPQSPFYDYQIAYIPLHSGSASLGWENPWVNVALGGHVIGERWSTNEHQNSTHIDSYTELSATVWRRFHIGRPVAEVRFDLKNLTDRQYEIVRSYPMPGRCWQLTLKIEN
jgi:outer membrane cobalamin receptor